jgi:hypothetical protein
MTSNPFEAQDVPIVDAHLGASGPSERVGNPAALAHRLRPIPAAALFERIHDYGAR